MTKTDTLNMKAEPGHENATDRNGITGNNRLQRNFRSSSDEIQVPTLTLDDPTLPPFQCMIDEQTDGVAVLWNLRNDFPLYVNGSRVTKATLADGDIVTIGQSRFVFACEEVNPGLKYLESARQKSSALAVAH